MLAIHSMLNTKEQMNFSIIEKLSITILHAKTVKFVNLLLEDFINAKSAIMEKKLVENVLLILQYLVVPIALMIFVITANSVTH